MWAQEKAESQQALRAAHSELSRLREEVNRDAVARMPVSSHESDTNDTTWPHAKVGIVVKRIAIPVPKTIDQFQLKKINVTPRLQGIK